MNVSNTTQTYNNLVADILDCCWLDVTKLAELYAAARHFNGNFSLRDDELFCYEDKPTFNRALYACMNALNNHLYVYAINHFQAFENEIQETSTEKLTSILHYCEEQISDFSPFINSIDTHFNNLIDYLFIEDLNEWEDLLIFELKKKFNLNLIAEAA